MQSWSRDPKKRQRRLRWRVWNHLHYIQIVLSVVSWLSAIRKHNVLEPITPSVKHRHQSGPRLDTFLGEQSSGARDGDCGGKLLVCVLQINKHDRTRWYEYCGGAWAGLHKSFLQLYSGRDSEITTIAGPCVNVLCVYNSSKISVLTFPEFYDLQEIDPKYCQLIETPVNFGNCTLMLKLKLKFNGIHRQGSLQSVLIKFKICMSLCDVMCGDHVTTLKSL